MLIRCINTAFRDNATAGRPWRAIGDEWEATPERLAAINRAGYGIMAEAVPEAPGGAEHDGDGREPADATKRAAWDARRPQSVAELEAMTVRQLVELCVLDGVVTPSKPKKEQLVTLLAEHWGLE